MSIIAKSENDESQIKTIIDYDQAETEFIESVNIDSVSNNIVYVYNINGNLLYFGTKIETVPCEIRRNVSFLTKIHNIEYYMYY